MPPPQDPQEEPRPARSSNELPHVAFRVPATLGQRPLALDLVAAFVEHARATDEAFRDEAITAFSEAFNAVVARAYHGRSDGTVGVELELGPDTMTIRLSDDGLAVDFTRPPQPAIDDMPNVGLGIFLIHATVDEVTYESGTSNVLTLTKRLHLLGSKVTA